MLTSSGETPVSSISQRIIATGIILGFLYMAGPLMMTIVVSVLMASTLDPSVRFLNRKGMPRGLAAMTMVLVVLGGTYLGFYLFARQASEFVTEVPKSMAVLRQHALHFREKADQFQRQIAPQEGVGPQQPAQDHSQTITDFIGSGWRSFSEILVLASFIPFLVYFFLTWKSHLRRSVISMMSGENRVVAERTLDGITRMIHGFVVGNFIIGVMLSVISTAFFYAMRLPYAVFLGPMSGFLSLVPYFGVVLALGPPVLVALARLEGLGPIVGLAIGIVILHLVALNVLYPKIVGSRVHLNPVIVTLSIMFWGWLWGGMGLILAVPITAAMKAICDNVSTLRPYGRFLGD